MSEFTPDDYQSAFEALPYTLIERRATFQAIVTTAVVNGEVCEFDAPYPKVDAQSGRTLKGPEDQWQQN